MERAGLICDRSGEMAALVGPDDVGNVAIELLRAADHDETTLTQALVQRRRQAVEFGARNPPHRIIGHRVGKRLIEHIIVNVGEKLLLLGRICLSVGGADQFRPARLLEAVVAFLGVKARGDEVGSSGVRR